MLPRLKAPESAAAAEKFVKGGVKTITAPRAKIRNFAEDEADIYIKTLIFGNSGTGKTYLLRSLLELGFKVLVLSTDLGGDGLGSVIIPLRNEGTWNQYKKLLRSVEIEGYDEIANFLARPETVVEDIYDWDPDFIFWDGMTGWQINDIGEKVGDYAVGDKASAAEQDGLQLNQQKWGQIQRATYRGLSDFCSMRNTKTGKIWHKIGTCLETIKSKGIGAGGGFTEGKEPYLQGAGGRLASAAFDLVIRTAITSSPLDEDGSKREFWYVLQGHQNLAAKVRGYNLPPKMKADGKVLMTELFTQMGLALPKVEEGNG